MIKASSKKKSNYLYNLCDRNTLLKKLEAETEPRLTLSMYRYQMIADPAILRDELYASWQGLGVLGRIYLAEEGINAQFSIPESNFPKFREYLEKYFPKILIKRAVEDTDYSFLKLIIKVRTKILSDGQEDGSYDVTNVGKHLTADEFNQAMKSPDTIVVDVRNRYESEVGHFEGALLPDVDSFRDELPVIKDMLEGKEERKVLLYCTGGIRCEKTSAWLKHQGFKDVNQLHGGIIDYAHQVKEQDLESKFVGKNFVFDGRLGERISNEVISKCHTCGETADDHGNCEWQACHVLFIQCDSCRKKLEGCCSEECQHHIHLPMEEQIRLRKAAPQNPPGFFKSRRRMTPKKEQRDSPNS